MKRFKKTLHPKLKKKAKSVSGISTVAFPTNEELRREFPELIAWTGGAGFLPIDLYPVSEIVP